MYTSVYVIFLYTIDFCRDSRPSISLNSQKAGLVGVTPLLVTKTSILTLVMLNRTYCKFKKAITVLALWLTVALSSWSHYWPSTSNSAATFWAFEPQIISNRFRETQSSSSSGFSQQQGLQSFGLCPAILLPVCHIGCLVTSAGAWLPWVCSFGLDRRYEENHRCRYLQLLLLVHLKNP